jgi:hypothetical protein
MRWSQPDPQEQLTDALQAMRFGYAGGDPVGNVDPDRRCFYKRLVPLRQIHPFAFGQCADVDFMPARHRRNDDLAKIHRNCTAHGGIGGYLRRTFGCPIGPQSPDLSPPIE